MQAIYTHVPLLSCYPLSRLVECLLLFAELPLLHVMLLFFNFFLLQSFIIAVNAASYRVLVCCTSVWCASMHCKRSLLFHMDIFLCTRQLFNLISVRFFSLLLSFCRCSPVVHHRHRLCAVAGLEQSMLSYWMPATGIWMMSKRYVFFSCCRSYFLKFGAVMAMIKHIEKWHVKLKEHTDDISKPTDVVICTGTHEFQEAFTSNRRCRTTLVVISALKLTAERDLSRPSTSECSHDHRFLLPFSPQPPRFANLFIYFFWFYRFWCSVLGLSLLCETYTRQSILKMVQRGS